MLSPEVSKALISFNKDDLTHRNLDMFNHIRQNGQRRVLDERRDARKKLNEMQPILAECKTKDCDFKAFIDDVSSSGAFIKTRRGGPWTQLIGQPELRVKLRVSGILKRPQAA